MTFIKQMKERPRQLLMIFLVGLLLLVISLPGGRKKGGNRFGTMLVRNKRRCICKAA